MLFCGFIRPQKLEPCPKSILPVEVFPITNVEVPIRFEFRFDICKHVLGGDKVGNDVRLLPDSPLGTGWPIRTATYEESLILGYSCHFHGQWTGRVAYFHGAIDVKADQYRQMRSSSQSQREPTLRTFRFRGWNVSPAWSVLGACLKFVER